MDGITLKLTSPIGIDGGLLRAGTLVEVAEHEARNLLHRGKAVLATADDMPAESDSAAGDESDELRTDGPTLEEFVAAGYLAENYPPSGYAAVNSKPSKPRK